MWGLPPQLGRRPLFVTSGGQKHWPISHRSRRILLSILSWPLSSVPITILFVDSIPRRIQPTRWRPSKKQRRSQRKAARRKRTRRNIIRRTLPRIPIRVWVDTRAWAACKSLRPKRKCLTNTPPSTKCTSIHRTRAREKGTSRVP